MTSLEVRPTFDSTSAAGAMLMRQVREPVLVGFMLVGLGTSSAHALPSEMVMRSPRPVEQTTAGASIVLADRAGPAIAELRRSSGFTWDQLARLFNVSRLRGYRAIGYARGEAPLGYAEPSDDRVIEYDEDVLAALDQEDDFA